MKIPFHHLKGTAVFAATLVFSSVNLACGSVQTTPATPTYISASPTFISANDCLGPSAVDFDIPGSTTAPLVAPQVYRFATKTPLTRNELVEAQVPVGWSLATPGSALCFTLMGPAGSSVNTAAQVAQRAGLHGVITHLNGQPLDPPQRPAS